MIINESSGSAKRDIRDGLSFISFQAEDSDDRRVLLWLSEASEQGKLYELAANKEVWCCLKRPGHDGECLNNP